MSYHVIKTQEDINSAVKEESRKTMKIYKQGQMSHDINTETGNVNLAVSYRIRSSTTWLVFFQLSVDIILQAMFCLPFIKMVDKNEVVSLSGNKVLC